MKHIFLPFFIILSLGLQAQQNHFIYIQTENKQPFYVKMDKKLYSSTISGYLIIPRLKDSIYTLSIGSLKNEWPEKDMVCIIYKKDAGYILRNIPEKGWRLFNLQTSEEVIADAKEKEKTKVAETKTDAFSNMLSNVVNDPSIRQTEPAKEEVKIPAAKEEAKKEPVKEDIKQVPAIVKVTVKTEITGLPKTETALIRSTVTRIQTKKDRAGIELVYVDAMNGAEDTVRIFIPADQTASKGTKDIQKEKVQADEPVKNMELPNPNTKTEENKTVNDSITEPKPVAIIVPVAKPDEPVKKDEKPENAKFLNIELPNPNTNAEANKPVNDSIPPKSVNSITPAEKADETNTSAKPMISRDCKNVATDDDFLRLRKKMVAETNDDNMVNAAKKAFKQRCFTTEQIKNLSVLFLKDAGKYNFFDMAYPLVSDVQNYGTLENQLTDAYYTNRFKVMIRH